MTRDGSVSTTRECESARRGNARALLLSFLLGIWAGAPVLVSAAPGAVTISGTVSAYTHPAKFQLVHWSIPRRELTALYPGDFDGDGCTDLLALDTQKTWRINLSDCHGSFKELAPLDQNIQPDALI